MKISPATHGLVLGNPAKGYNRSPGLHMSDIYNSLYAKLYPKKYDPTKPMPMDKIELGLVFEEMLEEGLKLRLSADGRPGEFQTPEGIYYSPDLLLFNGHTRLGEIKLSWYSTRYAPVSKEQAEAIGRPELANDNTEFEESRFGKWMTQIMAYCYHLHVTEARLIVFFVNGNYKPPSPAILAWDLSFTEQELQENWMALLNHAKAEGKL